MGLVASLPDLAQRRLTMPVRKPHTSAMGVALMLGLAASGLLAGRAGAGGDVPPPGPNSPDEPVAAQLSLAKAAEFLDAAALDWTRKRQCGTCHTNYAYLIGRPALREFEAPAVAEIRSFFENRVAHWDDETPGARPRWDTEVVATACALALNDAGTSGELHPLTRKALDRMWTVQQASGAWNWVKCDWPPYEHDDYYGAVFAAVAVGHAPGDYAKAESARAGIERLRTYLTANPAPDLHHRTFLLWASTRLDGLMAAGERERTIQELRDLQHDDGGWSLPSLGRYDRHDGTPNDPKSASDGYATGLVVYVLRETGVPAADPALRKAAAWLRSHQRASGRWFTRSLSTDKFHYISHAGTAFAALAVKACEKP
jgi:squalene-hopene/tetraprenyl-beta-curcumene cyclase